MKQQAFAIKEVSAVNNQKNSRLLEIEKEEFYHYISKKLQSLDEEADQIRRESEEFSGGAVDD